MKSIYPSTRAILAGAALLTAGTAPAALAQETADPETDAALAQPAEPEADAARRLNTVTVTATQRVESIQDVPIAVTALDPELLAREGVEDVSNLESVAPSFIINSSDTTTGGTTLRLRGIGTTGNNIGLESSVGVFLDGVYLSRPGVALGDLLDLEQIEVLRGPQGTLFGRNTSAGALNVKTKAPDLYDYEGFGNITLGNFNLFNIQAGVNVPIVEDVLAVRVSGSIRDRNGFVEGVNGAESHDRDRTVLRGQALLDLEDAGRFRAIVDYAEADEQCCHAVFFSETSTGTDAFTALGFPDNGGVPNNRPGLQELRSNDTNFSNPFEQIGFSLEYNVDTPIGSLTYIGSYRDFEDDSARSTDFSALDLFTVGRTPEAEALGGTAFEQNLGNPTTIETHTHELRLQDTAFDGRLDWLVGLYYSDESIDNEFTLTLLDDFQAGVSAGALGAPANLLLGFANGVDASGDFAANRFNQEGESFSIFTHNVVEVTDKFDVTIGLRYVDETKDGSFTQVAGEHDACLATFGNLANIPAELAGPAVALNCFVFAAPAFDPNNPGPLFGAIAQSPAAGLLGLLPQEFDDTFKDDELVYTIKGSYKLNSTTNIYGGFTHGFKSGGFNLDGSAGAGGADPRFDSELIDAWEIGLKTDFWDGRARANIAAFYNELEDFQVLEFTGIRFETFNVDKAEAIGIEVETEAQLTDHLNAGLSVTYSDARYPGNCATQDPNDPDFNLNAANLCGSSLTNAPEFVTVFNAAYEHPVFDGAMDFFVAGSLRNETKRRTSTQPSVLDLNDDTPLPGDIQGANTKINLRAGLTHPDARWAVEVWGRNITDELTRNVAFTIPLRGDARAQFTQDPRTWGVTVRTRF